MEARAGLKNLGGVAGATNVAQNMKRNGRKFKVKRCVDVFLACIILILSISACGQTGPTWQEQYDLGIRYLSEGNYEEAIIAFTAAIEIDPKQVDAYLALSELYMDQEDYEAAVKILEQGLSNTDDSSIQVRLDEAKKMASIDFENLVSDALSYSGSGEMEGFEYHIPKINLDDSATVQLNQEIYDTLKYERLEADVSEYGYAEHSASYEWAVNGDMLSLVIEVEGTMWAWTDYYIYNVSILDGTRISDENVIADAGFTMDEYYTKTEQALGSSYWDGWNRTDEMFQDNGFCEMFNAQLKNTISRENVESALPYMNRGGQLCVIAPIYSLAGADYYYHKLNLSDFVFIPDYKNGVELQTHAVNISQDQAYQIACDYWDFTPGDVDGETGFEMFVTDGGTVESQSTGKTYYYYLLRWWVDSDPDSAHMSTCDWIYIDAETGECFFDTP